MSLEVHFFEDEKVLGLSSYLWWKALIDQSARTHVCTDAETFPLQTSFPFPDIQKNTQMALTCLNRMGDFWNE